MSKKFEITYFVVLRDGTKERHVTKVSNCDHDAHAKLKLDKHCEQKYKHCGYKTIEVISCVDVTVEDFFSPKKNIPDDTGTLDRLKNIFGMK